MKSSYLGFRGAGCVFGRAALLFIAVLTAFASSLTAAQPRAIIQNGNLVAADGTRLRAAPFFMGLFNVQHMRDNESTYREYFRSVSRDYGMNAVRICPWIGNWEYDVKNNTHHRDTYTYMIDKVVQWADEDNIYAVVNLHTQFNTVLTRAKVDDFWSVFASRYKDRTHVIYEAVNEPSVASAKSLMTDIYNDLRARAPNTHLILWSLADVGINNTEFSLAALQSASGINYGNASFGFHIYDWALNDRRRWDLAKTYRDAGYPVICTEFMSLQDADNLPIYYPYIVNNIKHAREASYNMSWMQWVPRFNYAAMDQYGTNHMTNAQIGFSQTYKTELLNAGIDFWSNTTVIGNRRLYDVAQTLYLHASGQASGSGVQSLALNNTWSSQQWQVELVSGSIYRIKNVWAQRYLHAPGTNAGSGMQVVTLDSTWTSQQWEITLVGSGNYRIKNIWSNLYLTSSGVNGGSLTQQALNTSSSAQLFKLPAY